MLPGSPACGSWGSLTDAYSCRPASEFPLAALVLRDKSPPEAPAGPHARTPLPLPPRCARRSLHQSRGLRHWPEPADTHAPECPLDRSCRTGSRTDTVAPSSPWRTAVAEGSESVPGLLGSSPIPHHLASVARHLRTEAASLHRRSPGSSVLPASPPPPLTKNPKLLDNLGRGFPCCAILSSLRAASITPARCSGLRRVHLLSTAAFPEFKGGSALASSLSRPARSSLRAAPRRVAEPDYSDSFPKGFIGGPLPNHHASVATEASRRFLGRDLPPQENSRLFKALLKSALVRRSAGCRRMN